MTDHERWFLEAYYKACYTSDAEDWLRAALAAKQMYNKGRAETERDAESVIRASAQQTYEKA